MGGLARLAGCRLRECWFEPTFHKHAGALCAGLQIHVDDPAYRHERFRPWRLMALAFKARAGTHLHFALPADWALPGTIVASQFGAIGETRESIAFWEGSRASQPAFLGHAILEAASQRP